MLGVTIIFLCWVFLFLILKNQPRFDWRESFLAASVLWASVLVVFTEILSVFNNLNFSGLFICWIAVLAASVFVFLKTYKSNREEIQAGIKHFPPFSVSRWLLY